MAENTENVTTEATGEEKKGNFFTKAAGTVTDFVKEHNEIAKAENEADTGKGIGNTIKKGLNRVTLGLADKVKDDIIDKEIDVKEIKGKSFEEKVATLKEQFKAAEDAAKTDAQADGQQADDTQASDDVQVDGTSEREIPDVPDTEETQDEAQVGE